MSLFKQVLLIVGISVLAGCSTMNSEFSCKVTAGDSCLSIEKVDEMTHFADEEDKDFIPRVKTRRVLSATRQNNNNLTQKEPDNQSGIWLAPWKDKKGNLHGQATLYAQDHTFNRTVKG
jgi:hypothetical protein